MNAALAPSYSRDTIMKAVKLHVVGCVYECDAEMVLTLHVRRLITRDVIMNLP